jgi:ubiquinone/menaquinone biosynthesis C-methylase UbiE
MNAEQLIRQMNAYYARRAPFHDSLMSYDGPGVIERREGRIVEMIRPHVTGKRLLEIGCGTGNWTQVLAGSARSILATDLNDSVLAIAREKQYDGDVLFRAADFYDLSELPVGFEVALMADIWSHIPKSRIRQLLEGLHRKLRPGSIVLILDMLPSEMLCRWPSYVDDEGNNVQQRLMPEDGGEEFLVVKNFPSEAELTAILADLAVDIQFREFPDLKRWLLTYTLPTS